MVGQVSHPSPSSHIMLDVVGDLEMLKRRRSLRFMAALAGAVIGFAIACTRPAAAQQADQPAADSGGGLEDIVVAVDPAKPRSIELANVPYGSLSGSPTDGGGATVGEPRASANGIEGFIEGGVGSHGLKTMGGAVTVPLVKGKLQLSVEGYETHAGVR